MARIVALCLACLTVSGLGRAQSAPGAPPGHAPPPPIVLQAAPPPELPPAEYPRRPFELSGELLIGLPNCTLGSSQNERCDGVAPGPGLGAMALYRPSPYFAFGGTVSALKFGFRPAGGSGLSSGGADGHFWGLLTRLYFFDHGLFEPYLELGLGSAGIATRAQEADAEYDESSAGLAFRAGGGLEFHVSRRVRLGAAYDWTQFYPQQLRRCGRGRCVDLDGAYYGHGTGFSTASLRVSILVGPGL